MIRAYVIGGSECIGNNLLMTPDAKECDIVIVNYLPNDLLIKTALGYDTVLLKAFLTGKKVYFIKNCFEYEKFKNEQISIIYREYRTKIEKLGITYINSSDDITKKQTGKKIITNNDVLNSGKEIIVVNKNSIITPLAIDTAREKNITFIRK